MSMPDSSQFTVRGARRRAILRIGALASGGLLPAWAGRVLAQSSAYPLRPVRILVGYSPGGTVDAMARLIADNLRQPLRQTVVVENHPGASGNIAAQLVARSAPDGHTLLFGNPAEIVINKFLMKDMGFDPETDLTAVVQVFNVANVMVVPAASRYRSLQELLDDAKRNPGKVTYASAGSGTPGHLAGETLALRAKAPMVHVPYKGGAQALTDVIGGHVDFYFAGLSAAIPHWKGGKIRLLAMASPARSAVAPDVPTVAEVAVPGFDFPIWGGLFAPAATPRDVVALLNREINQIYRLPEVEARLASEQSDTRQNSPAQFGAFVRAESEKYGQIIKEVGVR
jgi:tripartite-type tricarboxylate transporter receptor subunit TctC